MWNVKSGTDPPRPQLLAGERSVFLLPGDDPALQMARTLQGAEIGGYVAGADAQFIEARFHLFQRGALQYHHGPASSAFPDLNTGARRHNGGSGGRKSRGLGDPGEFGEGFGDADSHAVIGAARSRPKDHGNGNSRHHYAMAGSHTCSLPPTIMRLFPVK
uniref:Uncharacterized protein n=1 Tax=uncultured marine microorganism HF4000_APKG8K5 TaxID=455555 RepID=B3TB51_9ZZZZ|nr:hypothetical protein ALOHA_HF4000APKG8K5ctg1g29 [uncultured marine microorganism HF4000_APKG8K5]